MVEPFHRFFQESGYSIRCWIQCRCYCVHIHIDRWHPQDLEWLLVQRRVYFKKRGG